MRPVFVFGSNKAGRHGAGAALEAKESYGAKYGVGEGKTGNAYAIPTKDENLKVLSLQEIANSVYTFLEYAENHPDLTFNVTEVGCGLAGYSPEEIAPLFWGAPDNCIFSSRWRRILDKLGCGEEEE